MSALNAFVARPVRTSPAWRDVDGAKIFTISADGTDVDHALYLHRLAEVKAARDIAWEDIPHFVIFHQGASAPYLVMGWWANDNELFQSVSVRAGGAWVEDPERYSFCVYDLEVFWHERNAYLATFYGRESSLYAYRDLLPDAWVVT